MKAFEIKDKFGIDALVVGDRPQPQVGPGQVLVQMRAWSLNYRDLLVIKGQYNPRMRMPMVPLSDGVGVVTAVGPGVSRAKVGDRVAATFLQNHVAGELTEAKSRSALGGGLDGVLAEYVVLHEEGIVHVPEHLSDEEAATLPCAALTAWHALFAAGQLQPGDSVLLLGTGGVSIFALQFAKLAGARIIITSSSDEKLKRARELGATEGINYTTTPDWEKRVREIVGDRGVDHVVEVGGAGTLPRSLKAVRPGGRISLIGILSGAGDFNPMPVLMKNVCLQGIFVGSREMFEGMNRAIAQHRLRPVIDRVFTFGEARQALHYLESGAHFGKIAIRI